MAQFDANGVDSTQAMAGLKKALQNATSEGKSMDEALSDTIGSIKNAKTETEAMQIATELFGKKGAAEMTKNPLALASALRKISADPDIEAVKREDVAQLFIEHPGKQAKSGFNGLSGLFATHPPIQKRIEVLEQF